MIFLYARILIYSLLFSGVAAANGLFALEVDTSVIKTYADYDMAQTEAWRRYDERKSEAWRRYDEKKSQAFDVYESKRLEALREARAADRAHYLEWLDAKALGEWERAYTLQQEVPALAAYETARSAASEAYEAVDDAAYAEYQAVKDEAYEVYRAEKDMAYEAYLSAESQ